MIRPPIAALILSLATGPATAQPQTLEGDWLGFAVTAFAMGVMVPVVEHLHIDGDRIVQRGWTGPLMPCAPPPDVEPACAPPIQLGEGRLELDKAVLRVAPLGPQVNPFNHPTDASVWPEMALAGHAWSLRGDDRRMILARPARVEGTDLTLERIYFRAPPDMGGQLFDYLFLSQVSVGQSVCGLGALSADPALWSAFAAALAEMAPVLSEIRRIELLQTRTPAESLRRLTLVVGTEEPGDVAVDVSDLPEAARAAVLALRARQSADREALLRTLLWPAPEAARQAEADCLAYLFEG